MRAFFCSINNYTIEKFDNLAKIVAKQDKFLIFRHLLKMLNNINIHKIEVASFSYLSEVTFLLYIVLSLWDISEAIFYWNTFGTHEIKINQT